VTDENPAQRSGNAKTRDDESRYLCIHLFLLDKSPARLKVTLETMPVGELLKLRVT
jgi:hypothetical protein